MAEDRIITLRFKDGNAADMELYSRLEEEKSRLGVSMPAYVKDALRQQLKSMEGAPEGYCDGMRKVIREEMASLGTMLAGTIAGMIGNWKETGKSVPDDDVETELPGYSEKFPEGLNGVLEQFK